MKKLSLILIELYQKFLSPDHSIWSRAFNLLPYCKFTPSCSEYMKQSINTKGFVKGGFKGLGRLCRCHPFSKGGYDPVDDNK